MNVYRYLMVGAITVVMALLPVSTIAQQRVQISTHLTQTQLAGLEPVALQIQNQIPGLAYHIMQDPSCMTTLIAGIRGVEWDTDFEVLNRTMRETGCFDPYTRVNLLASTPVDWPPAFEMVLVEPSTLYIKIEHFFFRRGDIATEFLRLGLLSLEAVERVIVDLRGNPGGYIDAGMDLLGFFPAPSAPLQRQMAREIQTWPIQDHEEQFSRLIRPIILVDGVTASISEVVAGVLAATYPDTFMVGERTHGKGAMQNVLISWPLEMVYTTGEFILPGGEQIQGRGIAPTLLDIEILACGTPLCILERVEQLAPAALAAH